MKQESSASLAFLLRASIVLATFVAIGLLTATLVNHTGAIHHTPPAQIHLAAMMAGLFAGGAAAVIVLILFAFGGRKPQA